MSIGRNWKIGKLEVRMDRHSHWAFHRMVHYSGHMHTFRVGPLALVVAWNRPDPFTGRYADGSK